MSFLFISNINYENSNEKKKIKINIGIANKDDIYSIRKCNINCLPIYYNFKDYQDFISNENYFLIAAKNYDEVIGYIMGIYYPKKFNLHIISFAVDTLYRRFKVGTKLMNFIIELVKKKYPKIKNISLNAMEDNYIGNKFYQNYGFIKFSFLKDYYSKDKNGIAYVKNI